MFIPLAPEEALLHSQRVPWDSRDPTSSHWSKGGGHAQPEGKASFQQGARQACNFARRKQKKISCFKEGRDQCNHVGFQPEGWQGRSSAECFHPIKCGSSICRGPIR